MEACKKRFEANWTPQRDSSNQSKHGEEDKVLWGEI